MQSQYQRPGKALACKQCKDLPEGFSKLETKGRLLHPKGISRKAGGSHSKDWQIQNSRIPHRFKSLKAERGGGHFEQTSAEELESQPPEEEASKRASRDPGNPNEVALALKALNWYKETISPLLPNSCRFLPTCSSYSVQAYKEFGNLRGTVLTAWRLTRCSPLNLKVKYQGKYDPPVWPPVGLEWAFKYL